MLPGRIEPESVVPFLVELAAVYDNNFFIEHARGEKRPPRNGTVYHPTFVEYCIR